MPGRIITLQRQVRELGRLRAGLVQTGTNKDGKTVTYPTSSKTWILTAATRDNLDAAAQLWGGDVHEWTPQGNGPKAWRLITETPTIDAILPPGDPLSQYQEMWSRGGCQRRCDGEQELLSGSLCLCRAQFGDDFHEQKQGTVCDIHTRLNVFLPDLPDIGVYRVETKGFWPANHMAGYIDMIKGQVGPTVLVPVRLRIEPRTKVKAGKTSQYIEIVVELRSRASFAEILEAPSVLAIGGPVDSRVIEGAPARAAIEAPAASGPVAPSPAMWRARFGQAKNMDELRSMWTTAGAGGALDEETKAAWKAAAAPFRPAPAVGEPPPADPVEVDWPARFATATSMDDLRAMWTACGQAGALDPDNKAAWFKHGTRVRGETKPEPAAAPDVVDGEAEPDRDEVWTVVMSLAGHRQWKTDDVMAKFALFTDKEVADGSGWDYAAFRDAIKSGAVA